MSEQGDGADLERSLKLLTLQLQFGLFGTLPGCYNLRIGVQLPMAGDRPVNRITAVTPQRLCVLCPQTVVMCTLLCLSASMVTLSGAHLSRLSGFMVGAFAAHVADNTTQHRAQDDTFFLLVVK